MSKEASKPKSPSPEGRGGCGPSASLLVGHSPTVGDAPSSRLASGPTALPPKSEVIFERTLSTSHLLAWRPWQARRQWRGRRWSCRRRRRRSLADGLLHQAEQFLFVHRLGQITKGSQRLRLCLDDGGITAGNDPPLIAPFFIFQAIDIYSCHGLYSISSGPLEGVFMRRRDSGTGCGSRGQGS